MIHEPVNGTVILISTWPLLPGNDNFSFLRQGIVIRMESSSAALINVILRCVVMGTRFLFVLVLAKFFTFEQLGLYGLFVAAVSFSLYLVGMEFYSFSTRLLVGEASAIQAKIVLDQFRLYGLTYMAAVLPLLMIFHYDYIDWRFAPFFYGILLTEHLAQEFSRLAVAIGHAVFSNVLLFVRSVSWAFPALVLFLTDASFRSVEMLLLLWLLGSATSVVIALKFFNFVPWRKFLDGPIRYHWCLNGLKIALPLLITSLTVRGVFTIDRYLIEAFDGLHIVGVYAVLIAFQSGMVGFIDASVFQFLYPRLIESYKRRDKKLFMKMLANMFAKTGLIASGFGMVFFLCIEPLLSFFGQKEYLQHIDVFWYLYFAHVLFAFSMVPQFALYAMSKDRLIMFSHIFSCCLFCLFCWYHVRVDGIVGVRIVSQGLLIAFFVVLVAKGWGMWVCQKHFLVNGEKDT